MRGGEFIPLEVVDIILQYVGYDCCHICKRLIKSTEDRHTYWKFNFCSHICYFHI